MLSSILFAAALSMQTGGPTLTANVDDAASHGTLRDGFLSLDEAIRRMTSLPAQTFQLSDRGLLKTGFAADIVIFDENEVQDVSTYDKPHAYSKGFHYVIVNGQLTVDNEKHTGVRSGKALYGPGR